MLSFPSPISFYYFFYFLIFLLLFPFIPSSISFNSFFYFLLFFLLFPFIPLSISFYSFFYYSFFYFYFLIFLLLFPFISSPISSYSFSYFLFFLLLFPFIPSPISSYSFSYILFFPSPISLYSYLPRAPAEGNQMLQESLVYRNPHTHRKQQNTSCQYLHLHCTYRSFQKPDSGAGFLQIFPSSGLLLTNLSKDAVPLRMHQCNASPQTQPQPDDRLLNNLGAAGRNFQGTRNQ